SPATSPGNSSCSRASPRSTPKEATVTAPEQRTLRLVPGGADESPLPRSVRRRAATRRRTPRRRDPITSVLSHLDEEPVADPEAAETPDETPDETPTETPKPRRPAR